MKEVSRYKRYARCEQSERDPRRAAPAPACFVVRRTVETTLRPPGISLGRGESCAGWTLLGLGSLQACEYRDNSIGVGAIGRPGIIELLRSEAT